MEGSKEALELSKKDDMLSSTVGCHPTSCLDFERQNNHQNYLNQFIDLAQNNRDKIIAIGEIGLDYDRLHFCPKNAQLKLLHILFLSIKKLIHFMFLNLLQILCDAIRNG